MEVKSVKERHTELAMHSVKFAKDEQGRRKGQEILFKWPDVEKQLGEHKHIYVVDARKTLIPGGGGQVKNGSLGGNRTAELYAEQVAFAMHEEQLRRKSKVLVKQKDLVFEPTAMGNLAYVVDPRIGFHSKALGVVMAEIPAGKRSGAHRHLYDEINLIVGGKGKVIVEDKEYNFDTLDVLSIPVFQWHQYFNTGTEPLRILGINTRLAMDNLGLSLTHQGEHADYV